MFSGRTCWNNSHNSSFGGGVEGALELHPLLVGQVREGTYEVTATGTDHWGTLWTRGREMVL